MNTGRKRLAAGLVALSLVWSQVSDAIAKKAPDPLRELGAPGLVLPRIPKSYRPYVEHTTAMVVGGQAFTLAKLSYGEKAFEELAFDAKGRVFEAAKIRRLYIDQFAVYGKIHPHLQAAIERRPRGRHSVVLWLDVPPLAQVDRPRNLPERPEKVVAALGAKHRQNVRRFQDAKYDILSKLDLRRSERLEDRVGTPFVVGRFSIARLKQLAEHPAVRMALLHETKGFEDLDDALAVSGANQVIASGIDGDGIKVAVFENCPDDTSDLDIEDSYSDFAGLACSDSDHATHVTAIIKNTTADDGFAPEAEIYSADRKTLAAVDWAIDEAGVSVMNQSFHRAAELGDGMSADDLYKDYKVLQFPWPTIVHAAGNWCSPGSTCDEGGNDVRDEFVNHKGFNTISVGNHNDNATQMSASSCFTNPTSPHSDRELPEISANGTSVTAVGLTKSGTSMASPAVAGSVALLQDARSFLQFWPEANRALLFAGATNVATHAGQTSTGTAAADAPNGWWQDISNGNDAFDGAGALNVDRSREIARHRWQGSALERGFDIGRLRPSSFDDSGVATETYEVTIPWWTLETRIKVALAWNSEATLVDSDPEEIYASSLALDLDIRVYDEDGNLIAVSQSWDNSYEIAEFSGLWGQTFTIKIKRWASSSDEDAESWFAVAWDRQ